MLAEAGDAEDVHPGRDRDPTRAAGRRVAGHRRRVYAINPMAVARYRDAGHSVGRKKSDHADAMTLANILRTDIHMHRPLPADSELVRAIAVLARAHQDATWRRTRAVQELRSLLREYYPGFLAAFADGTATNLASADARAVLAIAPTPAAAARLTKAASRRRCGEVGANATSSRLADSCTSVLRQPQLRQTTMVEQAMGAQALALLAMLNAACDGVDQLARRRHRGVPPAPRPPDHHQLPGPGRAHRRPGARRNRRRPHPVHRRPLIERLCRFRAGHPRLRPKPLVTHRGSRTTGSPPPVSFGRSWR